MSGNDGKGKIGDEKLESDENLDDSDADSHYTPGIPACTRHM